MSSELPPIPEDFSAYEEELVASVKDSIRLELKASDSLKPWDSKVGGLPYFPKEMDYPMSKTSGKPLMLLAQINFEDMPKLEGYPEKGIVQVPKFFFCISDMYQNLHAKKCFSI